MSKNTVLWTQHHDQQQQLYHSLSASTPNPAHRCFNHNNEQQLEAVMTMDTELMFEKYLTPSDVGKLNRLVIPKQHAERYFPLAGDLSDKGLLLSFEDDSGKCWRFRYSYWSSSQSYVMTRGWSRFVKDKHLDTGDVVLFHRHRTTGDFFIGWRSGNVALVRDSTPQPSSSGDGASRVFYPVHPVALPCQQHGTGCIAPTTTVPAGSLRRLRLFGVNMECQTDESDPHAPPDGSSRSSQLGAALSLHHHQQHYNYSSQVCSSSHTNN